MLGCDSAQEETGLKQVLWSLTDTESDSVTLRYAEPSQTPETSKWEEKQTGLSEQTSNIKQFYLMLRGVWNLNKLCIRYKNSVLRFFPPGDFELQQLVEQLMEIK